MRSLAKDAQSSVISRSPKKSTRSTEANRVDNVEPEVSTITTELTSVSTSQTNLELGRQDKKSSNSSNITLFTNPAAPTAPTALSIRQNSPQLDRHNGKSSTDHDTTHVPVSRSLKSGILVGSRDAQSSGEFCRCKCHLKITHQWPQILKMSGASNMVGLLSRPSFSYRCSDHACKGRQALRAGMVYVTPSWLRKKAIFISVFLRGLRIERHIRALNIVPTTSDAARYAVKGDMDGLRRLFSQRLASVYDCTPDGWSLLHVRSLWTALSQSREII